MAMIIGYARVSTTDQSLNAQHDALAEVGADRLFSERVSGAKAKRPELDKMLDQLCDGDVVVVTKYDRLARSLRDLLDIVEAIKERAAGFRSLAEDIDTTTPARELIFHVFASIAHFERRRIAERSLEGLGQLGSMAASVVVPNFVGPRRIVFNLDNTGVRVTALSKSTVFMGRSDLFLTVANARFFTVMLSGSTLRLKLQGAAAF